MKHPHAEIIKALADDDSLMLWYLDRTTWTQYLHPGKDAIRFVAFNSHIKFHLGPTPPPRMIETPYGSYPEPLREAPKHDTKVVRADNDGTASSFSWCNYVWQRAQMAAGILHLTEEAAEQQAQVELKRRMAELGWEKS